MPTLGSMQMMAGTKSRASIRVSARPLAARAKGALWKWTTASLMLFRGWGVSRGTTAGQEIVLKNKELPLLTC
jgi:hypothetical protein